VIDLCDQVEEVQMSLWTWNFTGNGDFIRLRANFGTVTPDTVVVASITELDAEGFPFIGGATVEVHNVSPQAEGWLDVIAAVFWDSPLRCRISLAIFD
jgi:hypothetical protein